VSKRIGASFLKREAEPGFVVQRFSVYISVKMDEVQEKKTVTLCYTPSSKACSVEESFNIQVSSVLKYMMRSKIPGPYAYYVHRKTHTICKPVTSSTAFLHTHTHTHAHTPGNVRINNNDNAHIAVQLQPNDRVQKMLIIVLII
jgi:hypothetical protein